MSTVAGTLRAGPARRGDRLPCEPRRLVPLTSGGLLAVLVAAMLAAISLREGNAWLFFVACATFATVVTSHLLLVRTPRLELAVSGPDRAVAGTAVEHRLRVHNPARRSTPAMELRHRLRGFEDVTVGVPPLPPGGRAEVVVRRAVTSRGVAVQHSFDLRTVAPFGVAGRRGHGHLASDPVVVHPAVREPAVLDGGGTGEAPTGRPARQGHELHGLREWRPGDTLRQVHWRATARRDELVVVVPELTERLRVAFLLAGDPADAGGEDLLATTVWSAVEAVRRGSTVRLAAAGGTPEPLVTTDTVALLDWSARVGAVAPADPDALRDARGWAGDDGIVVVAAPPGTPLPAGVLHLDPAGTVGPR